ncbi:hypothetical protein F3Y22_tig00110819pilonHSYRG00020 [Hibiscus syriacus]|uniref:RING-type domain-containing protein n=1 Tax=Hibiscus syriacus TaxID=106335 RepID=A0A6A2ZN95_HIBSY|nr:uncharacterized protein LOC120142251 [Hibiscus syriacus]KAE8692937.1 hypothetical protein F3Y22_tig00110819pilonHSYRG00020 [Hibiscus syriacus]
MSSTTEIVGEQLAIAFSDLSLQDQDQEMNNKGAVREERCQSHGGICAICLDKIVLQETALIKDCEHAYCVTCILRWASYSKMPTCPQCKHPFKSLNVHRSLDGRINDYMFEESVCLLLRATWFEPLNVEEHEEVYDDVQDYYSYYPYEDEDEEVYYTSSPSLRIGNRRWGDNGYVRSGRREARPLQQSSIFQNAAASSSTSSEPKKKEVLKNTMGRRAKRALKREAEDKAAAAKHQEHLMRLGRK